MTVLIQTTLKLCTILGVSMMVIACGGGSGADTPTKTDTPPQITPDPKPTPDPETKPDPEPTPNHHDVEIKGKLTTFGDVFSHIDVRIEAKCLNQTGFKDTVVTDLYGEWTGIVDQRQFPCKIKAETADHVYYSYIFSADRDLNINPLTSFVIVEATQQLPEQWYASVDQLSPTELTNANIVIRNELTLKHYDLENDVNFFSSSYYDLLNDLKESVNKSQAFDGYRGLVEYLQQGKLSMLPQAPEDYARLQIQYDLCTGSEYQGNTHLLTHCSAGLLPDFKSSKLVQANKAVCEVSKQGEHVLVKSNQTEYRVKINAQADDKITAAYPIMNTLLLAEGQDRVEMVFQYDLLTLAAAYKLDAQGNMVDVISCS